MTSETQQSWEQFISLSTRITFLLRRAAPWLTRASAAPAGDRAADAATHSTEAAHPDDGTPAERGRGRLPWWASHHPAVSFRGPDVDDDRR